MMALPSFHPDFASPREWAEMYRECGLQVIPARYPMLAKDDKRPAVSTWKEFENSLAPPGIFEGWFPANAKPNMGCITGRASGDLIVIDLDDYKGGAAAIWWRNVMGHDPETWQQRTGGGGRQFFFRLPPGAPPISSHRTPIADIRCQGGFAMLPPSRHMNGQDYGWMEGFAPWECEIEIAPPHLIEAVVELIESHRQGGTGAAAQERTENPATDFDAFGNRIDGRETYMRDIVWASVLNLHRRMAGVAPDEAVAKEAYDDALDAYLRSTRTRLQNVDNVTGLEREGRGPTLFLSKWQTEMRKWDGKVAKAAAERPFEVATVPPASPAVPPGEIILTAAEFVAGFIPPEYLVDGMIQQGYLYSLTARTGHGKTAIGLYLAQCVARGLAVKDRVVKQGAVLFLAGENPDDIRARFLVLADAMGFDPASLPIHFIAGVVDLAACLPKIREEAARIPDLSLVIIDTAAAYFKGDDGNSNAQMGEYARLLRQFTFLPGKPAVVVPSHPVKNASKDNLLPVGGGAFLNEVDGNLTLWAGAEQQTTLHWQGKFRGPEFEPMTFRLDVVNSERVVNAAGELMPSVVAQPVTEFEIEAAESETRTKENVLLGVIGMNPNASVAVLARKANFIAANGQPQKSTVFRLIARLADDKLVEKHRNGFRLTQKGRREIGLEDA